VNVRSIFLCFACASPSLCCSCVTCVHLA
jgi:hypothetical protein